MKPNISNSREDGSFLKKVRALNLTREHLSSQ